MYCLLILQNYIRKQQTAMKGTKNIKAILEDYTKRENQKFFCALVANEKI